VDVTNSIITRASRQTAAALATAKLWASSCQQCAECDDSWATHAADAVCDQWTCLSLSLQWTGCSQSTVSCTVRHCDQLARRYNCYCSRVPVTCHGRLSSASSACSETTSSPAAARNSTHLLTSLQRRWEPQRRPGKPFSRGPSGVKIFEFWFLKWRTLVNFIFLSDGEAPKRRWVQRKFPLPPSSTSLLHYKLSMSSMSIQRKAQMQLSRATQKRKYIKVRNERQKIRNKHSSCKRRQS